MMASIPGVQVTFVYASILGLIFLGLGFLTIAKRRRTAIPLGSSDSDRLRSIRAHANISEYVPIAFILLGGAAMTGAPIWFINSCGTLLVAGRLFHAVAIFAAIGRPRIIGIALTLGVIGASGLFIPVRLGTAFDLHQ